MNEFYTQDMQVEDLTQEVNTLLDDLETLQADKDKLIKILDGIWKELFGTQPTAEETPAQKEWRFKITMFYCQG